MADRDYIHGLSPSFNRMLGAVVKEPLDYSFTEIYELFEKGFKFEINSILTKEEKQFYQQIDQTNDINSAYQLLESLSNPSEEKKQDFRRTMRRELGYAIVDSPKNIIQQLGINYFELVAKTILNSHKIDVESANDLKTKFNEIRSIITPVNYDIHNYKKYSLQKIALHDQSINQKIDELEFSPSVYWSRNQI